MTEPADVVDVLLADHVVIRGLLDELEAAERPEDIRQLYLRIAAELAAHEAAEQQVVFPALAAAGPASDKRVGEHEEINDLLAEMRSLPPTGFAFTKRASALVLDIRGHFECEEESVFPRLRALLAPERLVELGTAAKAAKDAAPSFPPDHAAV